MAQAQVTEGQIAEFADFTSLDVSAERNLIYNALRVCHASSAPPPRAESGS